MKHELYNPDDYSRDILNISTSTEDKVLDYFRNELKDPFTHYDLAKLYDLYESCLSNPDVSSIFRGALGFLIFSVAAEEASNPRVFPKCDPSAYVSFALKQKDTFNFILNEYGLAGIPKDLPHEVVLHKVGTTSYILRVRFKDFLVKDPLALKLLKYRYIDNKTINQSTQEYESLYNKGYKYMPKMFSSNSRYILMEFIDGLTIKEYIYSEAFINSPIKDKIIKNIVLRLCSILKYFGDNAIGPIIHGDLNPSNIILTNSHEIDAETNKETTANICMIDFGINYLVHENIGSNKEVSSTRMYIADEVIEEFNRTSVLSDIYSLGIIILEMFNVNPHFDYREFDCYLDNIRVEDPVLAAILDEILSPNPKYRLFDMQAKYKSRDIRAMSNIYSDLKYNFDLEFRLREVKKQRKYNRFLNIVLNILHIVTLDFKNIVKKELAEAREVFNIKFQEKEDEYSFRFITRRLGLWSLVGVLSHITVVIMFIVFFIKYYNNNTLKENIWGLLVCFIFSFVAIKYYLEIFADLYPKKLGRYGWWTNITIRFCTIYWPVPIFLVYYFGPKYWPYATFFGTLVVAFNNFICYKLAKKAEKEIKATINPDIATNMKKELDQYSEWWQLMAVLAFGSLIFGILLINNILRDESAYALIIIIVCFKMYKYNNIGLSPIVRNTLHYYYSRYYRAIKYKEMEISEAPNTRII